MSWLKDLLKKWKVQVTVVGGVLVVATMYGTCNYELPMQAVEDEKVVPAVEAE